MSHRYKEVGFTAALAVTAALVATVLVTGCANHGEDTGANVTTDAVAAGVPAIDGGANMGNSQSGAISRLFELDPSRKIAARADRFALGLKSFFFPQALASVGCGPFAVQDSCSSGVKQANYSNCVNWGGELSGSVTLTYSDSACGMTSAGDSVRRIVNLTRGGISGRTIVTTSTPASAAYDGTPIGSGATLTNNGNSYTYAIGGVEKTASSALGAQLYDVEVMTTSPMTLTGDLSGSRRVDGGSIVLFHNTDRYKATFSPHQLQYDSPTCCHPTAGSIDVSLSGSMTASGTVTFNGTCGEATMSLAGHSRTIQLQGCE